MKIAVTGANGYIGKHVIEALKKTNHTIIPVDINKTFNCINADILSGSPQIYQSLLAPDALIHLAWKDGFNHNAESHIENLYSHFLFLKNMIDSGCSNITVMGTMHECGFIEGMIDDSTACNPLSLYGIAKNALRQMLTVYTKDKNISLKWLTDAGFSIDEIHGQNFSNGSEINDFDDKNSNVIIIVAHKP